MAVLGIFWIFERALFPVFLVASLVFVIAETVRQRRSAGPPRAVAQEAARVLIDARRTRRGGWSLPVAGRHVFIGQGSLSGQVAGHDPFLSLAAPIGRRVPFAFAVRPEAPPVRWVHLVENTPISGARFEYALRPVAVGGGLEVASNHPGLLQDWLKGETLDTVRSMVEAQSPRLQGIHFDGRSLVSLWAWDTAPPEVVLRLAATRTLYLARALADLLEEVRFNQPI